MAEKKWSETTRIIDTTNDTEICILDGTPLMNKRVKKSDFFNGIFKYENKIIDTGDFFPPSTIQFPFYATPGTYGVSFNDPPIEGLNERNFNLQVDFVSHDGAGEDGSQDILQTLITKDGLSYTRKLYHVNGQNEMSATDFKSMYATKESPIFTGSVIVPNATLSTQAVNKGQLDIMTPQYTVYNNMSGVQASSDEKVFHIYTFSLATGTFELNLNEYVSIGSILILKHIGNNTLDIISPGGGILDGQDIDDTALGTPYIFSGNYNSITLYKISSTDWIKL